MAILNDFKKDFRHHLIDAGVTSAELAKKIGSTPQSLSRMVSTTQKMRAQVVIVNNQFVRAMEGLGYDVKVEYVPRSEESENK